MPLRSTFFSQPTVSLAQDLLGMNLVHAHPNGTTVGKIVETEAYLYRDDPACHAARGKTKRNAPMFGRAGTSYVYLIYGMHLCFNVVSGKEEEGEAVLIRALEPLKGQALMEYRRGCEVPRQLCNGPGKLAEAMGIDRTHNTSCLRTSTLYLERPTKRLKSESIVQTTRVGISAGKELKLRFYFDNCNFVSRK